jgi:protein-disulfide isomerase
MKRIFAALLLAAAPLTAALGQNWLSTVVATDGGHRLGNPAADKKLVEFVSYTCPHCGAFFREGDGALKLTFVQPGKGSVEVRHFIRDVVDLTAVVLVNCGDSAKFWGNHDMFFARQATWMATWQRAQPAQRQRWQSGATNLRMKAVAGDLGFYTMMESRGYTRTELDSCLNDGPTVQALVTKSDAAAKAYDVHGTPSFVLNGKLLAGVHTWADLQKAL